MKKILTTAGLFLLGLSAFCQEEENGTIYISHPDINVVVQANKDYAAGNLSTVSNYYSDTAKWWSSGMEKFVPISEAVKMWQNDYNYFEDISLQPQGYPDFLHYKKGDAKIVQSWWTWTGKSKKSGEIIKVPVVVFDEFNDDGKIVLEYMYGDFSKMAAEEKM